MKIDPSFTNVQFDRYHKSISSISTRNHKYAIFVLGSTIIFVYYAYETVED